VVAALRDHGYVEGRNLLVEGRLSGGDSARWPKLARFRELNMVSGLLKRGEAELLAAMSEPQVLQRGEVLEFRNRLMKLGMIHRAEAASHLAPSLVEYYIPYQSQIVLGSGLRLLDRSSGAVKRFIQLPNVDAFHEKQPVKRAEILDRKVHA
jgi:hypothetical protein